jgi:hypothetical protein
MALIKPTIHASVKEIKRSRNISIDVVIKRTLTIG